MMLLQAVQVKQSYGVKEVIKGVNAELRRGDRIGLVGPNGEGKSTLMRLLAGVEIPEEGWVQTYGEIAYVPQALTADAGQTVADWWAAQAGAPAASRSLQKELGLGEHVWELPVRSLSGGEQTKVALLFAFSGSAQILFLDEPTNHLDLATLQWLEKRLKSSGLTLIVISHDRRFLDEVTTATWAIQKGELTVFPGSYTPYADLVKSEEERVQHQYDEYLKKKDQLEKAIRKKREWAAKGEKGRTATDTFARCLKAGDQKTAANMYTKAKAMEKRLSRLEPEERPEHRLVANVKFLNIETSERPVLIRGEELTFGYEGRQVLRDATFEVERTDRIALVGPNGAGKSTLLKLIAGDITPEAGGVRVTPTARLGYFDQVFASLDLRRSLLDDVLALPDLDKTTARLFLGSFLFRGDEVFRPLSTLSYGERVRFVFAKLILARMNTLILDEPTNHLDIVTREKVEEALSDYPGAIVVASHDRYFLEKMTNKVWEIKDGKLTVHPYGFADYMERQKAEQREEKRAGKGKGKGTGQAEGQNGQEGQHQQKLSKKQRVQEMKERVLLLETRLAQLSFELSEEKDAAKKLELDAEFIRLSREKNQLRRELE